MISNSQEKITLRPWSESDFWLLERLLGDPSMTEYLGGPETPEQLRKRHKRYYAPDDGENGRMFVIMAGADAVGSVGYWEREWRSESIWKIGWSVLPKFQKRGLATKGVVAVIERVRAERRHRFLHAFPATKNLPSNALCQKVGFMLLGEVAFEYPPGNTMHCDDWRFRVEEKKL